jgi:hypothetical protein
MYLQPLKDVGILLGAIQNNQEGLLALFRKNRAFGEGLLDSGLLEPEILGFNMTTSCRSGCCSTSTADLPFSEQCDTAG